MENHLVLTSVTKPSDTELNQAILFFTEESVGHTGEEVMSAGFIIMGEACSLLDDGKTTEEILASLATRGLSEECATPFVEKAAEIVKWNQVATAEMREGSHPGVLAGFLIAAITMAILAYFYWH